MYAEKEQNTTTIYGFVDPDDGTVRYVGRTKKSGVRRRSQHFWVAKNKKQSEPLQQWLLQLYQEGKKPGVVILAVAENGDGILLERELIEEYSKKCRLLNIYGTQKLRRKPNGNAIL